LKFKQRGNINETCVNNIWLGLSDFESFVEINFFSYFVEVDLFQFAFDFKFYVVIFSYFDNTQSNLRVQEFDLSVSLNVVIFFT
jgi:hypothetical protein